MINYKSYLRMELKKQVCRPELAEKLLYMGTHQKSYFGYFKSAHQFVILPYDRLLDNKPPHMSAFTAAELGEMLPEWCYTKLNSSGGGKWCGLIVEKHKRLPETVKGLNLLLGIETHSEDTEADARAQMLIKIMELSTQGEIKCKLNI